MEKNKKKVKKSIEKEILEERKNKKEEKVEIDVIKKSNINIFKRKFNDLKVKYKKDPKKSLLFISSLLLALALLCGTSYAYLTYIGKTGNTTLIEAGTLALTFKNESNAIVLDNAVPQSDEDAINNNKEYEFDITNTGSIPANYVITLDNTCTTSRRYTINEEVISPDKCIPNEYIKVGIKEGDNDYKVVEVNEDGNIILEAGSLNGNKSKLYKMKIWLSYDTPNDYNSLGTLNIIYSGKLGLNYEQKSLEVNKCNEVSLVSSGDTSNANAPVLSDNMIPVYYDTCEEVWKKADKSNENGKYLWYNYDEKMWANSVTVSSTNRETYKDADLGTEIPMDDILTMQVWVPRYKYTVWNYNSAGTVTSEPQEINIEWEKGTTTTGEIECTDLDNMGTSDGTSSGTEPTTSETCKIKSTSAICTNSTCNEKTYTHPAFTFGDKELTGFWVGKFEVSSDSNCTPASYSAIGEGCNLDTIKPLVKPDVTSWRGTMVGTFENNMMTMNDTSNKYGFATTDDTHMMKNMEWGAVAYLTQSKYGMCDEETEECREININNSSGYYTGRSGGNIGGSTPINGTYTDQTSTTQYNKYGYYTYDGYLLEYGTNTKSETRDLSKVASTTGNIYGVYDMSGGAYDYVMGNIVSPDGNTMMSGNRANTSYPNYHSGYSGILYYDDTTEAGYGSYTGYYGNYPDDKYYDKYSFNTSYSTRGRSKLGDGIKEVYAGSYGWYSDDSRLVYSYHPWFFRGGGYNNGSNAGVFYSNYYYGFAYTYISSRLVISQTN